MKIDRAELCDMVDVFYKIAGELKVPEAPLKEACDFAIGAYCWNMAVAMESRFYFLNKHPEENKQLLEEMKLIYGACKRASSDFDPSAGYNKRIYIKDPKNSYNTVCFDVELIIDPASKMPGRGWWQQELEQVRGAFKIGKLSYVCNISRDFEEIKSFADFNHVIYQIKRVIRHELQHYVQSYIGFEHTLDLYDTIGGLPSKKLRDKHFDKIHEFGVVRPSKDDVYLPTEIFDLKDPSGKVLHELRDVEFYTRLSDAITIFNRIKKKLPVPLHMDFANAFIARTPLDVFMYKYDKYLTAEFNRAYAEHMKNADADTLKTIQEQIRNQVDQQVKNVDDYFTDFVPDRFFKMLRKYQPKKYEKAVSVFITKINL
jgi:hypothetical protein